MLDPDSLNKPMDTACEGGTDRNVAAILCLLLGKNC